MQVEGPRIKVQEKWDGVVCVQKDRHQAPGMEEIGDVLGTGGPRKAEVSLGRLEWAESGCFDRRRDDRTK